MTATSSLDTARANLPLQVNGLTTPAAIAGLTLPDLLERAAAAHPERPAITQREQVMTYAELAQRAHALAHHLIASGLAPGGRVGLVMEKSPEALVAFLGVAAAGGVVFPMDYNQPRGVLRYILQFTGPTALVVDERFQTLLEGLPLPVNPGAVVVNGTPAHPARAAWERVTTQEPSRRPPVAMRPADPVYLNFTSGTTGSPKGAVTTHLNLLYNTLAAVTALELTEADVHLCMFPVVAHPHELILRPLFLGGEAALVDSIHPGALARVIAGREVTAMMAVASIYQTLAKASDAGAYDLSSLRVAESGGMHVPPELAARFRERYGAAIVPVWGSTETSGVALAAPLDGSAPAGSMGKPAPFYDVRVIDDEGGEAAPGVVGEMAVGGPGVCLSYFNNPEETAKNLREGWFVSGDLVKRDEDGFFYFVDRRARMMKVGGLKVFCAEIEAVLRAHPGVDEVAVVRVMDQTHGELPKAFVVPAPGQELDAKGLRRFLDGRLARYKHPRLYEFRETLPRNSAGKIHLRRLEQEA
jgi:acyl-CoA synthetase (AMP-forming)/AMP-acid ligase II